MNTEFFKIAFNILINIVLILFVSGFVLLLPLLVVALAPRSILSWLMFIISFAFIIYISRVIWVNNFVRKIVGAFFLLSFVSVWLLCHIDLSGTIFDSDYCIEDGDCAEGREIVRNGETIIINKESCLEHSWKWDEKRKECKVRY